MVAALRRVLQPGRYLPESVQFSVAIVTRSEPIRFRIHAHAPAVEMTLHTHA